MTNKKRDGGNYHQPQIKINNNNKRLKIQFLNIASSQKFFLEGQRARTLKSLIKGKKKGITVWKYQI